MDAAEMEKEILLNLVIDRCPTCRGVWLDGGELEQMRNSIEEGLSKTLVRGMTYPG
jgi:Zn-finger nucleic acid-binding protein